MYRRKVYSLHPGFGTRYERWSNDPANAIRFDPRRFSEVHNLLREVWRVARVGGVLSGT